MTKDPYLVPTQSDLAEVFAVSLSTVQYWKKSGMPGQPGAWPLGQISAWLRTEGPWQPGGDPLESDGGDSPALERYRMAKAELAELDLKERQGSLIDRERARGVLGRWAAITRRMGEKLAARHGRGAAQLLSDALDRCTALVEREFGDTPSPGEQNGEGE